MGQLVFITHSGASTASSLAAVLDIYLSGANGDDDNDGLTPATAKATPAGVWALFPAGLAGPLVVHVGARGTVGDDVAYDWATMPVPTQQNETARIWIIGDGAGQVGEDGFEVITTGVATGGTDTNQITIDAVVANVYQHYTLEMTSGVASGFRRTIQQNTTTSIIPCRRFEDQTGTLITPLSGDTFRVIRPSVIFDGFDSVTGHAGFLGDIGGGDGYAPLFLVNVAFAAADGAAEINDCTIYMAGVEFRGTVFPTFINCTGSIGWWDNLNLVGVVGRAVVLLPRTSARSLAQSQWFEDIGETASLVRLAEWRGWGASCPDVIASTTSEFQLYGCQMSGMGTWPRVAIRGQCNTAWGGYFWGGLQIDGGSYVAALGSNIIAGLNGIVFRSTVVLIEQSVFACHVPIVMNSSGAGFNVGRLSFAALGGGTITTASTGISVSESSFVETLAATTITTSAGNGIVIFNDSVFQALSGALTVSAAAAALHVLSGSMFMLPVALCTLAATTPTGGNAISMTTGARILRSGTSTVSITGGALSMENDCVYMASGTTISSGAQISLKMTKGSIFVDEGTSSFTSTSAAAATITDASASFAALTLVGVGGTALTLVNGDFKSTGALNTTGGVTLTQHSEMITAAATIGGTLSVTNSIVQNTGALSCTTGITLSASRFVQGAAVTVSAATATCITLTNDSSYQQLSGILSGIATAGDGMSLASNSNASLLATTNAVLTGAGAGNVGLRCVSGGRAWFSGAPTSVTGPASADLKVGGNAAVANGTLAAANNFITDTDTTGALGGGNIIGRAA